MFNPIIHEDQARVTIRRVFFSGTTALKQGQGLCYDLDYAGTGTGEAATDPWAHRSNRVQLPDNTNNMAFAGVAIKSYSANAAGQWIEIYEPGSVCRILVAANTTINSTYLNCSAGGADSGVFSMKGFQGRGCALALETDAAVVLDSDLVGDSSATSSATLTKTDVGTKLDAGDLVYCLGGEGVTPQLCTVASVTDDNNVVLTPDPGDAAQLVWVGLGEDKLILAKLLDGEESGLTEVVTPVDNDAVTFMVGGVTYIAPATLTNGDSTVTIADGLFEGMRKSIITLGAMTSNDVDITFTHHETSDPEHLFAKAANDYTHNEWVGDGVDGKWRILLNTIDTTT